MLFLKIQKLLDYGFDNFGFVNVSENDDRFQTNSIDNLVSPFATTNKTLAIDKDAFIIIPNGVSISQLDTEVSFNLTEDSFATITYKYGDHIMGSAKMKYTNSSSTEKKKLLLRKIIQKQKQKKQYPQQNLLILLPITRKQNLVVLYLY